VNGLSVLEIGGYSFREARVRITATAALGKIRAHQYRARIELSGRFHDKGVHIIGGLFAQAASRRISRSRSRRASVSSSRIPEWTRDSAEFDGSVRARFPRSADFAAAAGQWP